MVQFCGFIHSHNIKFHAFAACAFPVLHLFVPPPLLPRILFFRPLEILSHVTEIGAKIGGWFSICKYRESEFKFKVTFGEGVAY